MMKILVLGGTGAMGKHLVNLLAERGDKVTVTTRSIRDNTTNIEYIQGNAKDEEFLYSLLDKQWDAIVDFMVYTTTDFAQRLGKLLAATTQYMFLSSARVYSHTQNPITEDSPRLLNSSSDEEFLATDEYSLAKARQEDLLKKSKYANWTIIRPYITYSEQRLQLGTLEKESWLYRALKGRTIIFSEDIAKKLTTLTYGLDVASAMSALIGEPKSLTEAYHITQSKACSWNDILKLYLVALEKHLGKKPKVILLDLDKFSRCKPAKYQINYDRMFNRSFNNAKVAEFVNVAAFNKHELMLVNCLEEFLKSPTFQQIDWRSEAIMDRYGSELANLNEFKSVKQLIKYIVYRFIKY